MNPGKMLFAMVGGFLPLFVFIAADHLFSSRFGSQQGLQYALVTAVAFGVLQAGWIYFREKRIETMLLIDTALIVGLGAISFLSGNDIFFKLKPAIIEGILGMLLGIVAFVTPKLMVLMLGRFTGGMTFTDTHLRLMQRSARPLFILILVHTGAIVYAAFYLSRDAWTFISGGLFYILMGGYFVVGFMVNRSRRKRLTAQHRDIPRDFQWKRSRIRNREDL